MKLAEVKRYLEEHNLKLLSRDQVLEADDREVDVVVTPEWAKAGFSALVISSMTGKARDAWEQSLVGEKGKVNLQNVRARLVVYSTVDESGNRIFNDKDIELLGERSAAALERCVKVAQRLNRLTDSELEDVKGNSGAVPSEGST